VATRAPVEKEERPFNFSLTEWLAIFSTLYFLSITIFAAGYLYSLPGRFIELFSFTDLIGSNIAFIQVFLGPLFIIAPILLLAVPLVGMWRRERGSYEPTQTQYIIRLASAGVALVIIPFLRVKLVPDLPPFLKVWPFAAGQLFWAYFAWVGYKLKFFRVSALHFACAMGPSWWHVVQVRREFQGRRASHVYVRRDLFGTKYSSDRFKRLPALQPHTKTI
jgi:hypothetical protein